MEVTEQTDKVSELVKHTAGAGHSLLGLCTA